MLGRIQERVFQRTIYVLFQSKHIEVAVCWGHVFSGQLKFLSFDRIKNL